MRKREKILVLVLIAVAVYGLFTLTGIQIDVEDGVSLLVAIGTVGMTLMLVYLEVFKSWIKKPEIKIEFENKLPFCRDCPTTVKGEVGHFIRLKIRNAGGSLARNLRGKLVEIIDKDGKIDKEFDPLFLHWTSIPLVRAYEIDPKVKWLDPIDLNVGEWEYLDVFYTLQKGVDHTKISSVKQKEDFVYINTKEQTRGCRTDFKMSEGLVVFKITIYGENTEPATEIYELAWDGKKYDEIKMYKAGRKEKLATVKPKKRANK